MHRRLLFFACALASLPALARDADKAAAPAPLAPMPAITPTPHQEWDSADSEGAITIRPVPEPAEDLPPSLQQAEYLRKHGDNVMCASYLKSVLDHSDLAPRDRARAILELADCLEAIDRKAEALCWLKIWVQLYPGRPEVGAVDYRMGTLYTQMGLRSLARDAYYLALSTALNQGQVKNNEDLKTYTRLTVATLWALSVNEYQAGQYARAAKLFDRYQHEATTATTLSLEKSSFLQADCYYQLKQNDTAQTAYEKALEAHPFNPLAPGARLRLYHLYLLKNEPVQAQQELQALIWSVRTVWPKDEAYWQQRTAETLMALNRKSADALPPLLQKSTQLLSQDKAWQKELAHYDVLAGFQSSTNMADASASSSAPGLRTPEQADLLAMQRSLDKLPPLNIASPTP